MQLTQIDLVNFRSYRGLSFNGMYPRILVAGLNGSGKSSIREAITWALTGHCSGTDGKGAGAEVLIPSGARTVEVAVVVKGLGRVTRKHGNGTTTLTVEGFTGTSQIQQAALYAQLGTTPAYVDAVLDTNVFLQLAHADAKAMVLALLNVQIPVGKESLSLGELETKYREAFEDRKGAKRNLQQFLLPPKPVPQEQMPTIEAIEQQLKRLNAALFEAKQQAGVTIGQRQTLQLQLDKANKLLALQSEVGPDRSAEIEHHRDVLQAMVVPAEPVEAPGLANLPFLRNKWQAIDKHRPENGCVLDPDVECKTARKAFSLRQAALGEEIAALEATAVPKAPDDSQRLLRAAKQQLAELETAQDQRERMQQAIDAATETAHGLREELKKLPDTSEQEAAMVTLTQRISKGEELLRSARAYWSAQEMYTQAETKQRTLKMEVDRLEALVEELGPKGCRVKPLAEAIGRFEEEINPYLQPFGWEMRFTVDPWMAMVNGRPADTYSESEQYRIGVALQLAIARISGLLFAVVDRVDILDAENRGTVTNMLLQAPLEQIIVLGTREEKLALPIMTGVIAYRIGKDAGVSTIKERSVA